MPDNTQLNPGLGGDLIKTEEVGGYKIPVSKIYLGAHGVSAGPVTATNPLPVDVRNFPSVQQISATDLPLPSGAALASKQPTLGSPGSPATEVLTIQGVGGMIPIKVDATATVQPISGTVGITGTVATIANLQVAGSPVSGGNPVPASLASPLPSGSNVIGSVLAQGVTGVLYDGATALAANFAAIAVSASGDNAVVSAVAGKKIRVVKYTLSAAGSVVVKFRSGSSADLTGPFALATFGGLGGSYCPLGLFETAAGESLVINLSGAVSVAGHLTYIEV
jgi:hypothetical protein